jgi:ABC-type Fe3+ transport system substrate-binding protein
MGHWPTIPVKNIRSAPDLRRPEWLVDGVLIHVVNVFPPAVRRVKNIFGPWEGRVEFEWSDVYDGGWRQGVTVKAGDPLHKDWRIVNEMEVLALQAMDDTAYYAWLKRYREQQEQRHVDGTAVQPT